jgi:uncharacterized protein (TIGR00725 family)
MRKIIVGIIGGHVCNKDVDALAQCLGKKLAKVVGFIICGGLSGVMKAVCSGFKAGGGITIGIIPSYHKEDANQFVDVVIPTGMGLARNVMVVKSADVVIALPGESGTLSEIAYCLQFGIPVVGLVPEKIGQEGSLTTKFLGAANTDDIPGIIRVHTVEETVEIVRKILKKN